MKKICGFLMLVILFITSHAQLKKVVLLEEATNASCGPCAANNPKLQKFYADNFGYVISVRYHAWWPGTDPMYSANTTENRDRITYYGISGVPTYVLDGQVFGVPGSPDVMENQMKSKLAISSPFQLIVDAQINGNQLQCTVTVKALENTPASTYHLRNAIVEREINYSTPPGTNGEKDFYCVFRKFLNNPSGETLPAMNTGETKTYQYTYTLNTTWQKEKIHVVSWIQNDQNKQVVQANASSQLYQIENPEPNDIIVLQNQSSITKKFFIVNHSSKPLELDLNISTILNTSNFSAEFKSPVGNVTNYSMVIQPGDTGWIPVQINAPGKGGIAFRITAENINDAMHYAPGKKIYVIKVPASVLLVDADGDYGFEDIFMGALDQNGISYVPVKHGDLYALAQQYDLNNFPAMIINNGWGFPTFLSTDLTILQNYLDNGGNLFIHGQDIGWDVYDASGSSGFARTFFSNYFHASYVKDQASSPQVNGISGDPISDGITFTLNQTIHAYYPDVISTRNSLASKIFTYGSGSEIAGVKVDNGTYKIVYLAFGLEQIPNASIQQQIITNSLNWFGDLNEIQNEPKNVARTTELYQNYPNPFNPSTTIAFRLTAPEKVELKIYDILGREVLTLIDQYMSPGIHQVNWDGKDSKGIQVSSGIYIYQLKAGQTLLRKKMILMK